MDFMINIVRYYNQYNPDSRENMFFDLLKKIPLNRIVKNHPSQRTMNKYEKLSFKLRKKNSKKQFRRNNNFEKKNFKPENSGFMISKIIFLQGKKFQSSRLTSK